MDGVKFIGGENFEEKGVDRWKRHGGGRPASHVILLQKKFYYRNEEKRRGE